MATRERSPPSRLGDESTHEFYDVTVTPSEVTRRRRTDGRTERTRSRPLTKRKGDTKRFRTEGETHCTSGARSSHLETDTKHDVKMSSGYNPDSPAFPHERSLASSGLPDTNIYTAFIRSVVDYLSPTLSQLSKTALDPLEKFQNKVMRCILGCPVSTRIANMQQELRLLPLVERIFANVTFFTVKCLHSSSLAPHYAGLINMSLDPDSRPPQLRPGGRALIRNVCRDLRRLDINVPQEEVDHGPPPWQTTPVAVSYTPTCRRDLPCQQKQLALEAIDKVRSSIPASHTLYVDGSLQIDGTAGCAVYSPTMEPPNEGWTGRRLRDWSSSTSCELHGLLDAVSLLLRTRSNGLVICDSQSALCALSSPKPEARSLVNNILRHLVTAIRHALVIHFLWIPSHVGVAANDVVDRLAKAACRLALPAADASPATLSHYKRRIRTSAQLSTTRRRNVERPASVSIQHYDHFASRPYKYRRRGLLVRRHNVVAARLRLGYRPVWQVGEAEDVPQYSSCKLCDAYNANHLQHYCLECPKVADLISNRDSVLDVCKYLLAEDNLDVILLQYPYFGGR
ncbi:uncharacterized protein LOC119568073 [Penaeus monodon]|uniref:uncharacterized protein LOC119568073 n=1 Tax=Penaeus monodon TaxID=6687 RepID=UPI0018A77AB0|nr:uncharacterized protein LOC119568073 [Penaeus monodon]